MVAAFGVGGIESPFLPSRAIVRSGACRSPLLRQMTRGEELGAFRIGSTVVLLWPAGALELGPGVATGSRVQTGQALGRVLPGSAETAEE